MQRAFVIRRLGILDIDDFRAIRLSALEKSPEAFGSVYAAEASRPIEHFGKRLASSLVFGAYDGARIVGMIGLKPEDGPKDAHKGSIWGFYTEPECRQLGIGSALIGALLDAAQSVVEQVLLSVVADNAAALALYNRFGFARYGTEPKALKTDTGYTDEVLMVLFLDTKSRDARP